MVRENSYVESMKFVKSLNEAEAAKESQKIQEKVDKINEWKKEYNKIITDRVKRERFHGRLLEACRNDVLGSAIKAIYITSLENYCGLSDDEIALAESIVENWVVESGGMETILSVKNQRRSYLLGRLAQIVEDAAKRAVMEVEAIEEADDDEPEEKEEKKEEKTDDRPEGADDEEETSDDEASEGEDRDTEPEEAESEEDSEGDEGESDDDVEPGDFPDEDLDKDTDNDDEEEEEPEEEDYSDELDIQDFDDEEEGGDEDTSEEEVTDTEETSDDGETEEEVNAKDTEVEETPDGGEEVETSEEEIADTEEPSEDAGGEEEVSSEDEEEAGEEILDNDPNEDEDDSDVEDLEDEDEEPDQLYKDLEDEEDVKKAIDTIQTRVADAEEKFIKKNAEDKKKVDEILHKINNSVKTVEEIDDDENPKAQAEMEHVRMYKRQINELSNRAPKTVFEAMANEISKSTLIAESSKSVMGDRVTEEVDTSADAMIAKTRILYGFLETLNTLRLEDVNENYIKRVIEEIN